MVDFENTGVLFGISSPAQSSMPLFLLKSKTNMPSGKVMLQLILPVWLKMHLWQSAKLHSLNLWELSCAGFRHSAGLHARVILDGAACRLTELGDVRDVLGVLGADHVVPIVLRVVVERRVNEEDVLVVDGK